MKSLRRFNFKNKDYFITIVTYNREPILLTDIDLFWKCWGNIKLKAWIILPDHFHCILNSGYSSISDIIHSFKIKYSRHFRDKHRPGRVWQNRFWDHMIRDEDDFKRHVDYIHYNPVKHLNSNNPFKYEYSSLTDYFEKGYYCADWGVKKSLDFDGEFGE